MLLILYERSDYQAIIKKINYYLKIQKIATKLEQELSSNFSFFNF